jgi:hypothetical protein
MRGRSGSGSDLDAARHLRIALGLLAVFLAAGLVLEGLLGLRLAGWMEDPLRRELVRLGHAHGGLLALVNLGVAFAIEKLGTPESWARRVRVAASVGALLVGLGFVGGGIWHGAVDPGPLVLFVPAGALLVLSAVLVVAFVRSDVSD